MAIQVLEAGEAADRLTGPGMDKTKALALLNRWRAKGILPPAGRAGRGKGEFRFASLDVACAKVMAEVADGANIRTHDDLKGLYALLSQPGSHNIFAILMDATTGGEPRLLVRLWYDPHTRRSVCGFKVRLSDDDAADLPPPGPEFGCALAGELALDVILQSFVEGA